MPDFTTLVDLAAERLGGIVLAANDEFFAPKENLLKPAKPIFLEDKYTDRGKWMDGWETRRRRQPGHDWCLIKLGQPGIIRGVLVDTSHFKGNYPESCSIDAGRPSENVSIEQLASWSAWVEVLPRSMLRGDTENLFPIENRGRYTHLRFNIFPDGGVARLRVYGQVAPDWNSLAQRDEIDLAAVVHGGLVLASSDMFFGSRQNLIMPGRAQNMSDGWETRRRRGPGHDWCIIQLGTTGTITRVEVDTTHFKGNAPDHCSLEGCTAAGTARDQPIHSSSWREILPSIPLQPDTVHRFDAEIRRGKPVSHVRFNIFPDGGVARLRLFGTIEKKTPDPFFGIERLNNLAHAEAEAALLACCGSRKWARQMADRRPFQALPDLLEASDRIWQSLSSEDWQEAFRAHPKIGEHLSRQSTVDSRQSESSIDNRSQTVIDRNGRPLGLPASRHAVAWSEQEQSGARNAAADVAEALARGNRAYEARFGHIFIICATGKTAHEMLDSLKERLTHEPETELNVAANEQRQITRLRLMKWLET